MIIKFLVVLALLASGCNALTNINNDVMDNDPNKTILALAAAFEKKDSKSIEQLINDPYQGFRFSENWTDEIWQNYAQAFQVAKEAGSPPASEPADQTNRERFFEITIAGKPKNIRLILSDKQEWLLDYSSFIVTPHLN